MRRVVIAVAVLAASLQIAPPALAGPLDALSRAGARIWDRLVDSVASGVQAILGIVLLWILLGWITRFLFGGGLFRRW